MNGFETKFQTDFMHAKIKMKETQNPMYNVTFPKYVGHYVPTMR